MHWQYDGAEWALAVRLKAAVAARVRFSFSLLFRSARAPVNP